MIIFYDVQNINSLFDMFDQCTEPIYVESTGSEKVDIRSNPLIKELLLNACQKRGIEELKVKVESVSDMPRIINYMMGCRRYG